MIIKGEVFDKSVYINTDKTDHFYNDQGDTQVVIGEVLFRVDISIETLMDIIWVKGE